MCGVKMRLLLSSFGRPALRGAAQLIFIHPAGSGLALAGVLAAVLDFAGFLADFLTDLERDDWVFIYECDELISAKGLNVPLGWWWNNAGTSIHADVKSDLGRVHRRTLIDPLKRSCRHIRHPVYPWGIRTHGTLLHGFRMDIGRFKGNKEQAASQYEAETRL